MKTYLFLAAVVVSVVASLFFMKEPGSVERMKLQAVLENFTKLTTVIKNTIVGTNNTKGWSTRGGDSHPLALSKTSCVPLGGLPRDGDFSRLQAQKIRDLYHLDKDQCLMQNIKYESILDPEEINAADGFPRQIWDLIKEPHVCPPKIITTVPNKKIFK